MSVGEPLRISVTPAANHTRTFGGLSRTVKEIGRVLSRTHTNKVLFGELAALQARVAELEAAAAHRTPVVELTTPAHRLRAELAALRKERDDLAERRAQIRSYQPGIEAEAKAWLAKIDGATRAADVRSDCIISGGS